ncbi:MAG: SGNH/GDSL hydrolase family protein [Lachnospiraceae bacterium]|nr:SGNH/GDSL hydrolase family protein [Lachnospiraceae bacterium]
MKKKNVDFLKLLKTICCVVLVFIMVKVDIAKELSYKSSSIIGPTEESVESSAVAETVAETVVDSAALEEVLDKYNKNVVAKKKRNFANLKDKDKYYFKEIEKLYHNEKDAADYLDFDMTTLKRKILNDSYFKTNMTLCGDSYCGYLNDYMFEIKGFEGKVNAIAGRSILENKDIYIDAVNNGKDIIVLSTSVNDVIAQTELKDFKNAVEELFKLAYDKGKLIVVHSYCDFFDPDKKSANSSMKYEKLPKYYDWIFIMSARKYDNAVYVDCNDIMNLANLTDGLHYNANFYKVLVDRIYHDLQQKFGF